MTENLSVLNIPQIIPVILCGGAGTRLWPLSQKQKPKQLLPIVNKTILLHDTLQRIDDCLDNVLPHIITVTTEELSEETTFQLKAYHSDCSNHVLKEPESKNTAAAIAHAALYAKEKFGPNAYLWILPADHHVENHENLKAIFDELDLSKMNDKILTFGIMPNNPETGYGYIEYNQNSESPLKQVKSFKEKPNEDLAKEYIAQPNYLWNSGMFLFQTKTILNEYIDHAYETLHPLNKVINQQGCIIDAYQTVPQISFDHAIMEKTDKSYVIEINIGWSDVGNWQSLWNLKSKDSAGNVLQGNIDANETENCYIQSDNLSIATMGLKDIVIVETENQIFIADRHQSHRFIPTKKTENFNIGYKKKVLNENNFYEVHELKLAPTQKTEYTNNKFYSHQLIIISGEAEVNIDNNKETYKNGETISIPMTVPYQIINSSIDDLIILAITNKNNALNHTQNQKNLKMQDAL